MGVFTQDPFIWACCNNVAVTFAIFVHFVTCVTCGGEGDVTCGGGGKVCGEGDVTCGGGGDVNCLVQMFVSSQVLYCVCLCVCRIRESNIWQSQEFFESSSVWIYGDQDIQIHQEGMLRWSMRTCVVRACAECEQAYVFVWLSGCGCRWECVEMVGPYVCRGGVCDGV